MSNIQTLLKSEISRISRKEVRKEIQPLRKAAATYRREIAALKRTIAVLDRRAKVLAKVASSARGADIATTTTEKPVRFVAKGLRSLRVRLDLSAPELAKLLSVSPQSIYNWEHKKATPRKEQLAAIVAMRTLGRREARQKLESLSKAGSKSRTSTAKKAVKKKRT